MQGEADASIPRRHVLAVVLGNALEFYDFTAFTFFTLQIGASFFPAHDPFVSLMLTLGTFGAGFLGRPLGGLVIGAYADRRGRKPAMVLCLVLMGAGIIALAFTPPYAAIGLAAPVIVIVARIAQGFALGGQVGPSTAYLMEASSPQTRGFYTTLQYASQGVAALAGGFVAVVLTSVMSSAALNAYGWRIAFVLGALVLPFGLVIQRSLPETLQPAIAPAANSLRRNMRFVVLTLVMLASATIAVYSLYYLPTYAQVTLHMNAGVASATGIVFGITSLCGSVIGGALSDRLGRRPVMIWPRLFLVVATVPLFLWLIARPNGVVLLSITAIVGFVATVSSAASLVAIVEVLPPGLRSGVLGTLYALAIATFGGSAQIVEAWLTKVTANALAPAWYLAAATLVGLVAMMLMPETAPARSAQEPA